MDRGRFSGSAFWLGGLVLLLTTGALLYVFGPRPEPPRVSVQHILISFAGAHTRAMRSKAAAEKLAEETLVRVRNGEDFVALMKQLSDDPTEGSYTLTNDGVNTRPREIPRGAMVKSFADVSFKLRVGAVRMGAVRRQGQPHHPTDPVIYRIIPPSITRSVPTTYDDAGEHR